jgi:hypothetical protein
MRVLHGGHPLEIIDRLHNESTAVHSHLRQTNRETPLPLGAHRQTTPRITIDNNNATVYSIEGGHSLGGL